MALSKNHRQHFGKHIINREVARNGKPPGCRELSMQYDDTLTETETVTILRCHCWSRWLGTTCKLANFSELNVYIYINSQRIWPTTMPFGFLFYGMVLNGKNVCMFHMLLQMALSSVPLANLAVLLLLLLLFVFGHHYSGYECTCRAPKISKPARNEFLIAER